MSNPPVVKGVTPKRIWQGLKSEDLFERGLELDPAYVPWMYVENILVRALARIVGQGPDGPTMIKCAKDGSLAVVARGGAFDAYERQDQSFVISGAERTTTAALANHLVDAGEDFVTEGIKPGDTVFNTTDGTTAYVVSVAAADLELSADIMDNAENYKLYPCLDTMFSRQMSRVDIFTYVGPVDYQLTRDLIQPIGAKIPLFEDSFYSLDFDTLLIRATCTTIPAAGTTRATIFGWYRLEG